MPHVVVGMIGETGLPNKVKLEQGGRDKVLHRNALKLCTTPVAEEVPERHSLSNLPTAEYYDPVPYSVWVSPVIETVNVNNDARRPACITCGMRSARLKRMSIICGRDCLFFGRGSMGVKLCVALICSALHMKWISFVLFHVYNLPWWVWIAVFSFLSRLFGHTLLLNRKDMNK